MYRTKREVQSARKERELRKRCANWINSKRKAKRSLGLPPI